MADVRGLAFRVWKYKNTCYSFNSLKRKRALALEFLSAPLAASEEFSVTVFGLG